MGAFIFKAITPIGLKEVLKGRTADQQKVIRYFCRAGGCLKKTITDEEYESMVMEKAKSMDFKKKALDKIGLDESQVSEVAPIHFEGYWWGSGKEDSNKYEVCRGKDGEWRTTAYQVTWIFFSAAQVYVYQYTFHMDEDGKNERTEEYFYKDITNFTTISESVEKEYYNEGGCLKRASKVRTSVETNRFALVVPGDKFFCAMKQNDYTEKAIQGMKAKLREKKG